MTVTEAAPRRRGRIGRRIGLGIVALLAAAAIFGTVFIIVKLPAPATALTDPPRGDLIVDTAEGEWQLGEFTVRLDDALHVTHPDAAAPVWETVPGDSFLTAADSEARFLDDLGLVRVSDHRDRAWGEQHVASAQIGADGALILSGTLEDVDAIAWEMRLSEGASGRLDAAISVDPAANRLYVSAALESDEGVHGLGAQSAGWDLRGNRVPLIPREQGIGRGGQPLSFLVDLAASAAGGQDTTYLPSAVNVTDLSRSLVYRGEAISSVDLRPDDRMIWEVWSSTADFAVAAAGTPAQAVAIQSEWTGAAAPPPAWASTGMIAGLQGGTDEVRAKVTTLQESGVPLAAVWLQDWVGRRTTDFGERLQWNWSLDHEQYPGWETLVADLDAQDIRVLTYVNSFLSADSGAASAARGGRDLYAEAAAAGYLALDADGAVLDADQHGFTAATVDLSNPDAREWFAQAIADEVAGVGASGWMADFAEGPPPEAVLAGGIGADWRVQWPTLWQQVNQRALALAGLSEEGFVWHRSGGTLSAGQADALWLGDQTQDWSRTDGLASTVTLTQSLSASGMAQVHGDIGGYTSVDLPVIADVVRDDELVLRWAEASLLQPAFRTHEGNRPAFSAQPAEDAELAAVLGDLSRVFIALAPERGRLTAQGPLAGAAQHPWMLAPSAELNGTADDELQMGPDVLLAPVLAAGATTVEVAFPPGRWQNIWTGEVFGEPTAVVNEMVDAPLGQPALFVREGTTVASELAEFAAQ
ncbi:TIM-barrel domain-containing protein [Microbacterium sp. A204]|uniref:TIM-barrel domain-containing protein n=1 Tax=Microbacterium sp. A204 TaxID=3457321 RepID=UPI003FD01BC7